MTEVDSATAFGLKPSLEYSQFTTSAATAIAHDVNHFDECQNDRLFETSILNNSSKVNISRNSNLYYHGSQKVPSTINAELDSSKPFRGGDFCPRRTSLLNKQPPRSDSQGVSIHS